MVGMSEHAPPAPSNRSKLCCVTFSIGRRAHGIPDAIMGLDLMGGVDRWVEGDWVLALVFADGRGVIMPRNADVVLPPPDIRAWLADRVAALNVAYHSGGCWFIAWRPEAAEAVLLFRDGNGVLRVVVDLVPSERGTPVISLSRDEVADAALNALRAQWPQEQPTGAKGHR
jgi:hypothetical protein